jgi:hypothetical protein
MTDHEKVERVLDDAAVQRMILKEIKQKNGQGWMEYFRLVTPFMTLVLLFYANGVRSDINEMKSELFHHLTNAEIHIPRASVVSMPEFTIYQTMRDRQMTDLSCSLARIEAKIDKHMEFK